MRRLLGASGLLLLLLAAAAPAETKPGMIETTYLGNEGFLIQGGGKKVLIDALFDNGERFVAPPPEVMKRIMAGDKPFDSIDLVLVTHPHSDHVNPELLLAYLLRHPLTRLVAPKPLIDAMRDRPGFTDRQITGIAMEPGAQNPLNVHGIAVDILSLDHAHPADKPAAEQVLVYSVALGGARFLHMGDAFVAQNTTGLASYPFDRKKVDVMFLLRGDRSPEAQKFIAEQIKPARIVAMHVQAAELESYRPLLAAAYPQAILFDKPMDTATFP